MASEPKTANAAAWPGSSPGRVEPVNQFPPLPDRRYGVIYADPPWDYKGQLQHAGPDSGDTGGAIRHYSTVTSADLLISDPGTRMVLSLHEADSGEASLGPIVEGAGPRTVRVKATASAAVSSETTVSVSVGAAGGTAMLGVCTGTGQSRSCSSGDYDRGGGNGGCDYIVG